MRTKEPVVISSLETVLIWKALERLRDSTNDPVERNECTELLKKLRRDM